MPTVARPRTPEVDFTRPEPSAVWTEPVLETENRVLVALAVDEPIAKSVVFVSPAFAWTERFAYGVVEPNPAFCVLSMVSFEVLPGPIITELSTAFVMA